MYECICYPTTEKQLREIARKAGSPKEFRKMTRVGTQCGTCECTMSYLTKIYEEENHEDDPQDKQKISGE